MKRLLFPTVLIALTILIAGMMSGCKHAPGIPEPQPSAARIASQKAMTDAQNMLSMIPPPVKGRYVTVHSLTDWQNPYLTVQADMVVLHVLMPDENPSPLGAGSFLRPVGARRQQLPLRLKELPDALSAVPENAWPYGRVIAVEEQSGAPQAEQPAIRRNMETVLKMLNDLGVVTNEWNEGGAF